VNRGLTGLAGTIELDSEMLRAQPIRRTDEPADGWMGWFVRMKAGQQRGATILAGLLVLTLGYHVLFGQNGVSTYLRNRAELQRMDEQVKRLHDENEQLQGHVDRLKGDAAVIEHQARQELHYTRPGEVIVTLPNDPPAGAAAPTKH
jgi:cell division protein FtsB